MRRQVTRGTRAPVFELTVIAALIIVGVGAAAPGPATLSHPSLRETGVRPLAAVAARSDDNQPGPAIITVSRPPTSFHIAAATLSAPPPSAVVNAPGALQIPMMALNAYRNAERLMAAAAPGCGISWNLLAGIGRIESMHANGGATDMRGNAVRPIMGPVLDGSLPGNEIIVQSRAPSGAVSYARALGPMQFLPGTWSKYASDGDGDGKADVQNVFDASLAAARYLCSGGLNMRDPSQVMASVLRYNNSMPYARNVLGWAAAYATGVVPVDLPPITGPIPPIGDAHLETAPEGLGPGLPANATGLPPTDPLSLLPVQFGVTDVANQMPPMQSQDPTQAPPCFGLVCFGLQQQQPPPVMPPMGSPQFLPGPAPGYAPGPAPGYAPGPAPGPAPGYAPGPAPGYAPGPAPGYMPGPAPGPAPAYTPGPAPVPGAPLLPSLPPNVSSGMPAGPVPDAVAPTQEPTLPVPPPALAGPGPLPGPAG